MSPFAYLLIPLAVVVLASLVVWLRGRQPQTLHSGIDGFQREMKALSPDARSPKMRRFDGETGDGASPGRGDAPGAAKAAPPGGASTVRRLVADPEGRGPRDRGT